MQIFDTRSLGSWCIKGTDESLPTVDSLVPLIHHDPSDLGSKIRIQIFPKKCTLKLLFIVILRLASKNSFNERDGNLG